MRNQTEPKEQAQDEVKSGETITARREYTLKKPIVQKGKEKGVGEKVKLNDRQAEWLKGSEHI